MTVLLPFEIIVHVLDLATQLHPSYANDFSLVSKDTQLRVERLMYKDLFILDRPDNLSRRIPETAQFGLILETLESRPAEFAATYVRNIMLMNDVPWFRAAVLLAKCTGLRNLSYWPCHYSPHEAWSLPCSKTLRCLGISADAFCGLAVNKVIFPELEQLYLDTFYPECVMPTFEWLPALKKMIISDPEDDSDWKDILSKGSTAPNLESITWHIYKLSVRTEEMKEWAEENLRSIKLDVRDVESCGGLSLIAMWRRMSRFSAMD